MNGRLQNYTAAFTAITHYVIWNSGIVAHEVHQAAFFKLVRISHCFFQREFFHHGIFVDVTLQRMFSKVEAGHQRPITVMRFSAAGTLNYAYLLFPGEYLSHALAPLDL